ncbi:winged helix-turn-helix domain-containing protein [Natrialba taiwanensis]|uniref:Putative transcriptional regulator n=1 Tax=Natrialba taiwanensis DSM 12281 TaxID=1230458 RepID=L9ZLM1_9EURY|nr:helix-turn-helix domain-containing protein [Natrialba taiwanensis]ELY86452.1 putative transcriptional regulator [Natrialba taiwanensis DSM 12281]
MPPDRFDHDPNTGDFSSQIPTTRILDIVRLNEPVSTGEVANELDCHRNTARYRLKKLEEGGQVEKEKIGQQFVWRSV